MIRTKDKIVRFVESAIKGAITYDEFNKAIGLQWWYDRVTAFNQIELLKDLQKYNPVQYQKRFEVLVEMLALITGAK